MPYVTREQLVHILSDTQQAQLSDDNNEDGLQSQAEVIDAFLTYAESFVNTYIGASFKVPVENPSPSLQYAVMVVAKYRLLLRREYMSDEVKDEYRAVVRWLEDVRQGKIDIFESNQQQDSEVSVGYMVNPVFGTNFFL